MARLEGAAAAMTGDERFAIVWQKVEWANRHIRDLDAAIQAFGTTNPYRIVPKRDPETRRPIYYMRQVDAVPTEISLILGDAIQNLRTALDHISQQLYLVGTGSSNLAKHVSFFIADSASEHERLVGGKVKGMTQKAIDAICALEPYKDGKGHQLWVLNKLNNIDKHRTLVACGGSFRSFDVLAVRPPGMPPRMKAMIEQSKLSMFMNAADKLCPLKVGDELYIGLPDEEFNPTLPFCIGIALNEPEIIQPDLMLTTVRHLAEIVSDTVKAMKPFLV
jgi:hypothetical protein